MTTTQQPIPTAEPVERPTDSILSVSDTLTVIAWHDPTVEQASGAMPTDSDDALVWYTPSVGTIGMAMAHRFARHATTAPRYWTVEDIARTFGVGPSAARVARSLDRLERFAIVRRTGRTVAVRLWLAPLTYRQRCALPGYLAAAYDAP
ncbi:MAG: hypothetical protein AB7J47_23875 [Acidimicrobiia bacterium]